MYYNVNKQNEDDKNSNAKRNQKNMKLSEKVQIDSSGHFYDNRIQGSIV